jgi:type IV secretion system protein VirB1
MIAAAVLACAVALVHPDTLSAVIAVESGGRALAVNVNGVREQPPHPADINEAAAVARRYIRAGHTVDLGLMQVNSANLAGLGLTVEDALDPCTNVRAGATILAANYEAASKQQGPGQGALLAALSAYNTGTFSAGFTNGYVAKFTRFMHGTPLDPPRTAMIRQQSPRSDIPDPYTADLTVYVGASIHVPIN